MTLTIHHYNSFCRGGAFNGAVRQHKGLLDIGGDSKFFYFVGRYQNDIKKIFRYDSRNSIYADDISKEKSADRIDINIKPLPICEKFSYPEKTVKTPLIPVHDEKCVIRNLHWLSDGVDLVSLLQSVPVDSQIVWTMHDMNPYTGGCHYNLGCNKYETECFECPQIEDNPFADIALKAFKIKERCFNRLNIHVVANSKWSQKQAEKSKLFGNAKSFQTIHYGIDCNQFHPVNVKEARNKLELAQDKRIICFGADRVSNKRKGFCQLVEALKRIHEEKRDIQLVTFGKTTSLSALPIECTHFGELDSIFKQRLLYSAADVFVIPSLQEAFGQTVLEAFACGTPVVGFKTGGIPDMIDHGVNGLMAEVGNVRELRACIGEVIARSEVQLKMGNKALEKARKHFDLKGQAQKYMDLYYRISEQ